MNIWEDQISLNSSADLSTECLESAGEYLDQQAGFPLNDVGITVEEALRRDPYPLPRTEDREGYYGPKHFHYWASGLRDSWHIVDCARQQGEKIDRFLDFGCASGRVIRHMALQRDIESVIGVDINRKHVDWVNRFLPAPLIAIQNHSVPTLPFPDGYFDFVTAFSVFTHIEAFETTWLAELKRILRPGGLAWVTAHTETTWRDLDESWPLYKGLANHAKYKELKSESELPEERLVFRWRTDRSYSSNVFYSTDYIHRVWGRIFEVAEIRPRFPAFQDVVVLRNVF